MIAEFEIGGYGPKESAEILKEAISQTSGLTLNSPKINGTIATTGLTLPSVTLGGTILGGQQVINDISTLQVGATGFMLFLRHLSGNNRIDSYDSPITATIPLIINALTHTFNVADITKLALTATALTLSVPVVLNGQAFDAGSGDAQINTTGSDKGMRIDSTQAGVTGASIELRHNTASIANNDRPASFNFTGDDVGQTINTWGKFYMLVADLTEDSEEVGFVWEGTTGGAVNSNMTLSGAGALWSDLSMDTLTYKVSGTQVVGARVVDAKIDDAINAGAWDATTAGVLEACRDALVTHGLVAAA